jgi:geranylgeranyl pyrophosphate synthase
LQIMHIVECYQGIIYAESVIEQKVKHALALLELSKASSYKKSLIEIISQLSLTRVH